MVFGHSRMQNYPIRCTAGAFILNSGLNKLNGEDEYLEHMFGMAVTAYPFLDAVGSTRFSKLFGSLEVLLGTLLLIPLIPDAAAGTVMLPFSAGLVGLYFRIPGMRAEKSLRPTSQGIAMAKDLWLLGISFSLVLSQVKSKMRNTGDLCQTR